MKSVLLLSTVLLISTRVSAKEDWICIEASSQRVGSTIQSCGIGIAEDEATARLKAFDSAKAEFDRLCSASDDCRGRKVTVDPKRTTCEPVGGQIKCYRMLSFIIAESTPQNQTQAAAGDPILAPTLKKDVETVNRVCAGDAEATGCSGRSIGNGLLRCMLGYKNRHRRYRFSGRCREALSQLKEDGKAAK